MGGLGQALFLNAAVEFDDVGVEAEEGPGVVEWLFGRKMAADEAKKDDGAPNKAAVPPKKDK